MKIFIVFLCYLKGECVWYFELFADSTDEDVNLETARTEDLLVGKYCSAMTKKGAIVLYSILLDSRLLKVVENGVEILFLGKVII